MKKIEHITLDGVLPRVFADGDANRFAGSDVWRTECVFRRGGRYLVEAESGTGKTSMCAFIYGLRTDYEGRIAFDGADVSDFSISRWCALRRNNIALLPQDMGLFPELTAMENIMLKNRLTDRFSVCEIVDMLDSLGVADKVDTPAARMSVGQQQRVAIIRSLSQPFDFIFLDEPVSHLDARNNVAVATLVDRVATAAGAAVISTSVGNPLALPGAQHIHI